MLRVYHYTSREAAADILDHGFAPADSTFWFTPDPHTVMGEKDRAVLLQFDLDLSDHEVAEYRREVTEEEIDPETDEVISESETVNYDWYEMPGSIVNSRIIARKVIPPDERRMLWLQR